MEKETAIKNPNLEREAKKCLKDMRKMYDETGKLTRLFLSKKMHMHLGYKDTPRDIRKCLKEHLNDPSLYSTICRWIQAIRIEEALKLEHELWSLTVLLEFNRYEENGWERIANQFADQEVPPTMNEFKKACVDLLNNQEIALRKAPRVTSAYFGEFDQSFRCYPITFSSSFSSLPVLP